MIKVNKVEIEIEKFGDELSKVLSPLKLYSYIKHFAHKEITMNEERGSSNNFRINYSRV